MRFILAIVPGIKTTGMAVYQESPTRILTRDRPEMTWECAHITTSTRPKGTSAKGAIKGHTMRAAIVLTEMYSEIQELWIEGKLEESTHRVVSSKAEKRRLDLVDHLLGLPAVLTTRQQRLTTVLVEPGEWREWVIQEGGRGTLEESIKAVVGGFSQGVLQRNTLYAKALGAYAGTFSRSTSTQPKSAKLPEE